MLPGVFQAQKKDGTIYFRSSFTFKNKHISLGSYPNELQASRAYREACLIMSDCSYTPDSDFHSFNLYFSKKSAIFPQTEDSSSNSSAVMFVLFSRKCIE